MARMAIDDMARRDQRLFDLANLLGWSVRETFGSLIDVWEICYDRITEVLPEVMVNSRVFREAPSGTPIDFDFAGKMVEVGYARRHSAPRMIVIAGAKKYIKYLRKQSKLGRVGGIKSGESRRKHTKGSLQKSNPPDLDLAPDLDPSPDRSDRERSDQRERFEEISPESASPVAQRAGGPDLESSHAYLPSPPRLRVVGAQDELVQEIGAIHAREFQRVKEALRSGSIGPDAGGPHEQLAELLRVIAPGTAHARCLHAIAVQAADALAKRKLHNFGGGMWKLANFEKALTFDPLEIAGKPKATFQARLPLIPDPTKPGEPIQYVTASDPECAGIFDFEKTIAEIERKTRPK